MTLTLRARTIALALSILSAAAGQAPILHYQFDEGGAPATTQNLGTLMPGSSTLLGHTLTGVGPNGSHCLTAVSGTTHEVTTPYAVALGTGSWSVGFSIDTSGVSNGGTLSYVMSDQQSPVAWRVFTGGTAGAGNLRLTGPGLPAADLPGGAGASGWVHAAWVHDDAADLVSAYLNGVLTASYPAPAANLMSGLTLRIGRHGLTSLITGTLVDDFRLYDRVLSPAEVLAWSTTSLAPAHPDFRKVMISEVSWGDPDVLEITNFGTAPASLANWTVKWRDNSATHVSTPLNVSIAPGESIVVSESLPVSDAAPGTQVIDRFTSSITVTSGAILVTLLDGLGTPVDEVRITDQFQASPVWTFGGQFRGLAVRGLISGISGQVAVERIWGLDSDGGADWTEQPNRSLGRENRTSGPRGTDPIAVPDVHISELARNPSYLELFNPGGLPIDVSGWRILTSAGQGSAHAILEIPSPMIIAPGSYAVLGSSAVAPVEKPPLVPYAQVATFAWLLAVFDCALYDDLGRPVDVVRVPSAFGQVVHNFPRAPSHWSDFVGATPRNEWTTSTAIGRPNVFLDDDTGLSWAALLQRSMGSANTGGVAAPQGHDDALDVRLDAGGLGGGLEVILNAGTASAGSTWNFLLSVSHSNGQGPFFGLGSDVLANFAAFYNVPPWSGQLDAQGSGRIDVPTGSLPPGINADFVFLLQNAGGQITKHTLILEFDT